MSNNNINYSILVGKSTLHRLGQKYTQNYLSLYNTKQGQKPKNKTKLLQNYNKNNTIKNIIGLRE